MTRPRDEAPRSLVSLSIGVGGSAEPSALGVQAADGSAELSAIDDANGRSSAEPSALGVQAADGSAEPAKLGAQAAAGSAEPSTIDDAIGGSSAELSAIDTAIRGRSAELRASHDRPVEAPRSLHALLLMSPDRRTELSTPILSESAPFTAASDLIFGAGSGLGSAK